MIKNTKIHIDTVIPDAVCGICYHACEDSENCNRADCPNKNVDVSSSNLNALLSLSVGDRLRFEEEKQAYTIQAKGDRYAVCTKPFNLKRTVLYTIVDVEKQIRGTENLILGAGAETREECEEMLARLEGRDEHITTEISRRNNVPLKIHEDVRR